MKEIKAHNSTIPIFIDDEDYDRVIKYVWRIQLNPNGLGVVSRQYMAGRATIRISLASEIMRKPRQMYDHVDRNPFNNSKQNLRPCNVQQNAFNRGKLSNKSSQYKGVTWNKQCNKWQAGIKLDGYSIHLGLFVEEKDAALAYNLKAVELFKTFAVLNKI